MILRAEAIDAPSESQGNEVRSPLREKLEHVAKTLVVEVDRNHIIVVLPGNRRLNIPKFKKLMRAKSVQIAKEKVMQLKFGVAPGAITAFGALHKKMPVVMDRTLMKAKKVVASMGAFEESLHMGVKDFLKATEAELADISEKTNLKLQIHPKPVQKRKTKKGRGKPGRTSAKKKTAKRQ